MHPWCNHQVYQQISGRPFIATSRIDKYDGENVTFHYTRHEDNKTIEECVPAPDFIKRLIIHIPEKHFRCYAIMASMRNIINRKRNCVVVSLPKSLSFFVPFRTGVTPYFSLSVMILYVVRTVVLPCRFWKFTTKKLHNLNDIESSWDMDSSIYTT